MSKPVLRINVAQLRCFTTATLGKHKLGYALSVHTGFPAGKGLQIPNPEVRYVFELGEPGFLNTVPNLTNVWLAIFYSSILYIDGKTQQQIAKSSQELKIYKPNWTVQSVCIIWNKRPG